MALAAPPIQDNAYAAALALLERAPMIDGHNDLPYVIRLSRTAKGDVAAYELGNVHAETDTDIPRMQAGKLAGQFFAAYVPPNHPKPAGFALAQIALMRDILSRHASVFRPGLSADDVEAAKAEGRIALFMTIENGSAIDNELDALDAYYGLGVRLMTLCHNGTHDWCDSATDAPRHNGLTAFGKDVIRRMNKLGMVVDLAHVSHKVMHDVLDVSSAPVVWSHSNAFSLCDHPRNVPDDVLDRVAAAGGVVMATFVPDFISQASRDWHRPAKDQYGKTPDGMDYKKAEADIAAKAGPRPKATLAQFCDHLDYLARRIGHDHIGIGSDFFGGAVPEGLEDTSTFPGLIAELIRRGWSEENLEKLAGGNTLRVLRAVEQKAG
ncbi:membrane dipeptidase [Bosea caraganae]|uniref:Membrane dipeptidase n=1 Tax=Bosea caraganae TaxID=2763117 RepID=A0A370LBK4_9HYPH|nr:dipeptidase [Bosea caraganae]RDJ27320.1 membrane dipeptidase [Bosea caraganae]RDJ29336.1 membrane dipeptidase [Bosea caraganae]